MYRPGAKAGSGSTADAVRHEKQTGELLSPKGHAQKAGDKIRELGKIIRGQNLSPKDRATAKNLVRDLKNALSGR